VHQELSLFSCYATVQVSYKSQDRVDGEVYGGDSLSEGWFQSMSRQRINKTGSGILEKAAYFGQPVGIVE